jgi:hypothetical protein
MKLVGERRALAALMFAFWFVMYLMNALLGGGPLAKLLYGLASCYGLAFFSLVAGYFWARWYSVGMSLFGIIVAGIGLWQYHSDPDHVELFQVLFIGLTHLTATIMLWGNGMSELYDGQLGWRERWHMDEHAVQRLGRSVIRAGVSLPMVLIYGLAPKQPAEAVLSIGALVLAGFGLRALVRMRTWGVLALGAAGGVMLALSGVQMLSGHDELALQPALAGALLVFAAWPWAQPLARAMRAR